MDAAAQEDKQAQFLERFLAAAGVATMAAGAAAVWHFDPSETSIFPVCPMYSMTGFACPGCGLTRGFHALFHGDLLGALDHNALLPFFAALIGFFLVSLMLLAVRGRGLRVDLLKPRMLWSFFILLIVFGIARNLPVYPFSILFP